MWAIWDSAFAGKLLSSKWRQESPVLVTAGPTWHRSRFNKASSELATAGVRAFNHAIGEPSDRAARRGDRPRRLQRLGQGCSKHSVQMKMQCLAIDVFGRCRPSAFEQVVRCGPTSFGVEVRKPMAILQAQHLTLRSRTHYETHGLR